MRARLSLGWGTAAVGLVVLLLPASAVAAAATTVSSPKAADSALDAAASQFVASPGGPPGIAVVVQRGSSAMIHTAGTSTVGSASPAQLDDQMRLASVSKAFSGAVALSLVQDRVLSLGDTIGRWLPTLPRPWRNVTLSQLLNHTSGIPDFSQNKGFQQAFVASLLTPPPPAELLSYVSAEPLAFKAGTRYHYSNSDNVVVGLMVQAATGHSYESLLQDRVDGPFELSKTSLPRDAAISAPLIHGYQLEAGQPAEDVSQAFAAGWSWASGGVNSTPMEANRFIRAYARGLETNAQTRRAQFHFVGNASSEPPGPGKNAAGLAIFEYTTSCGTVYGHTGNTAGYTQFIAATKDGTRSVTVSANAQITPKNAPGPFVQLRKIFGLAVCAALAGH
jgi:D-alanyl-D-alanine carboxypeptidase